MLVEEELAGFSPEKNSLLTIGVFDGVHLGHKHLIAKLREEAGKKGLLSGVVTFRQHPEELLSPNRGLLFLTDLQERLDLVKQEGVDFIVPLSFTSELAKLSAVEFVRLLQKHLKMRGLVIGPDFALGKGREGDTGALQKLGREMGFSVTIVPPLEKNGKVISSTAIRKALATGDMETAQELAGRYFSLHGTVVAGMGRGAGLGFPTANLDVPPEHAIPPDGVYAALAHINGETYQSMSNIGKNPTFNGKELTVETFLLDYHGDLYGRELKIDLVERLRGEKKFASVEELKQQIAGDVQQGKEILKKAGNS